jgi:hypothetical protein
VRGKETCFVVISEEVEGWCDEIVETKVLTIAMTNREDASPNNIQRPPTLISFTWVNLDSLWWPVDLRFGPADDRDHLQRQCKASSLVSIGALTFGTACQRLASV